MFKLNPFTGKFDLVNKKASGTDSLSSYFNEFSYTGSLLTKIETYQDSTKTLKLFTFDLTYTNGLLSQSVLTNELSSTTETKTFSYDSNNNLISVTKA